MIAEHTTDPDNQCENANLTELNDENADDQIDENDPLWKATLEITKGNKEEATRLLEDPDSLMKYPEIRAIMERSETAYDDWETTQLASTPQVSETEEITDSTALLSVSAASTSKSISSTSAIAADGDEILEDEIVLEESDPRPHLNLVFIGHVDAGKVSYDMESFSFI